MINIIAIAPHITDEYADKYEKKKSDKGFVLDRLEDDEDVLEDDQPPPGYYYEG